MVQEIGSQNRPSWNTHLLSGPCMFHVTRHRKLRMNSHGRTAPHAENGPPRPIFITRTKSTQMAAAAKAFDDAAPSARRERAELQAEQTRGTQSLRRRGRQGRKEKGREGKGDSGWLHDGRARFRRQMHFAT